MSHEAPYTTSHVERKPKLPHVDPLSLHTQSPSSLTTMSGNPGMNEAKVKAAAAAVMLQRGLERPEKLGEYLVVAGALVAAAQDAISSRMPGQKEGPAVREHPGPRTPPTTEVVT